MDGSSLHHGSPYNDGEVAVPLVESQGLAWCGYRTGGSATLPLGSDEASSAAAFVVVLDMPSRLGLGHLASP